MGVSRTLSRQLQQQLVEAIVGDEEKPRRPPVIAFFNVAMIGHVNPTFPLVVELVRKGCEVHYFLPPNEDIRRAARDSGAIVEGYVEGDSADFELERCGVEDEAAFEREAGGDRALWERNVWPLASTLVAGEHVIARCRELGVQAVLFDPMAPHGLLVSEVLGVPCVSLVTYPGMGSIADLMANRETLERAKAMRRPYGIQIRERFGVDLQDQLLSRRQYFSRTNLVTTSEDLVVPLPEPGHFEWADELREHFRFHAIGCMVSADAPHVAAAREQRRTPSSESVSTMSQTGHAPPAVEAERLDLGRDLPSEELQAAEARGAKVVVAALGTMALSDRWAKDLGRQSGGNLPAGTTGKDFCQHIWHELFAAMRRLGDGYHCVVCVGTQPDALDFLPSDSSPLRGDAGIPRNVTLRSSVPQVEMLRSHTDAFISHMGFNSMQESIYAGVPLIAVPQAIDQPANARKAEASGWGRAFVHPMESVTVEALEGAIRDVVAEGSSYRSAVAASQSDLHGGQLRAADWLIEMATADTMKPASRY